MVSGCVLRPKFGMLQATMNWAITSTRISQWKNFAVPV